MPDAKTALWQWGSGAVGHLCIFLPKFHCELNFIKFFWGVVKKYLYNNCDYTLVREHAKGVGVHTAQYK